MKNYLSVDLESWASPNLPEFVNLPSLAKKKLDNGHIKKSALHVLDLLKKYNTKITFFTVGQLYDWYPKVVEKIASLGHEIAYHTHDHDLLLNKVTLIKNIEKSKQFIQRFKPVGFRAPRISIDRQYLTILKKYRFKYDSSRYGAYREKQKINGIAELPVTSWAGIPIGSGYFIGALGKKISWLYKRINRQGNPIISFIHNWQVLKPRKPTFPTKGYLLTHLHYFPYMADCSVTFEYLLKNFKFTLMKNLLR